ncbi:hypothetical protein DXT63_03585, partial [Thermoanaerobacteraceae bacterium SP2]
SFFSLPWLASFSFISSIGVKFLLKTARKFEQEGVKKSRRKQCTHFWKILSTILVYEKKSNSYFSA